MKLKKKQQEVIKNYLECLLTLSNDMEGNACFLSGAFYVSLKEKRYLNEEPCKDLLTLCRNFHEDNQVNQVAIQDLAEFLGMELEPEKPWKSIKVKSRLNILLCKKGSRAGFVMCCQQGIHFQKMLSRPAYREVPLIKGSFDITIPE